MAQVGSTRSIAPLSMSGAAKCSKTYARPTPARAAVGAGLSRFTGSYGLGATRSRAPTCGTHIARRYSG